MKLLVAALIGGVVLGFVDAQFLMTKINTLFTSPSMQGIASTGGAAFLGTLWGWVAKGVLGSKPKE
jgi:hypothetical protein